MRWATAQEPNWYRRQTPTGVWVYQRQIVYCDWPSKYQYPHAGLERGQCLKFGGSVSWKRCSQCPHNEGFASMSAAKIPEFKPGLCATGDLRYDLSRRKCRACQQMYQCIKKGLDSGRKLRFSLKIFSG